MVLTSQLLSNKESFMRSNRKWHMIPLQPVIPKSVEISLATGDRYFEIRKVVLLFASTYVKISLTSFIAKIDTIQNLFTNLSHLAKFWRWQLVDGNEEFHNVIVSAMLTMEDEGGLSEYYRQKRNWKITDNATGVENYFLGRRLECFVIAPKLGKIRHDFSAVTNSR